MSPSWLLSCRRLTISGYDEHDTIYFLNKKAPFKKLISLHATCLVSWFKDAACLEWEDDYEIMEGLEDECLSIPLQAF